MIETQGVERTEAWAKGLVANLARPPQGGDTDQITAVAAGECDLAVVNHYYLVRLMKSESEDDRDDGTRDEGSRDHECDRGPGLAATPPAKHRGRDSTTAADRGQRRFRPSDSLATCSSQST